MTIVSASDGTPAADPGASGLQLSRRTLLRATAASAFAFPLLAACGDGSSAGGGSKEAVKIGGLFHKSGVGEIWGPLQERPAALAVEEINAAGGVLGRQIQLISEDDQTDPDVAVRKGTKLVQEDGVEALFGLVYSNDRAAVAANVSNRFKVPYFYPTYSEGGVCGQYYVNMGSLPNQQLDQFIPYLMERFGPTFYFVGQDYVWPRESVKYCKKVIADHGGKVANDEYVPIGKVTDWSSVLGRIRSAKPDVFFPFIGGDDLIAILRQFFDFKMNESIGLASTLLDESFITAIPEEVRGGIPCSASYFMAIDSPENTKFVAALKKKFGNDAITTNVGEALYDSIYMWKMACEKAGTFDHGKMIEALKDVKFSAPQGEVSIYQDTNSAVLNQIIAESQADGTFKILKNFGLTNPVTECKA
jgi:urea transport system substrate-binding protein